MTQVDRATRCIVSWSVATDREWTTMQNVVSAAPPAAQYDSLAVYATLVYASGPHEALPNKSQTYSVEANNAE